jgi:hypothetical protein
MCKVLTTAFEQTACALIIEPCVPGMISKLLTAKNVPGKNEYSLEYITAFREVKLH